MEYELRFTFTAGEPTAKRLRDDITQMARKFGLTNFNEPKLVIKNRYEKDLHPDEAHDVILVEVGQKKINVIKTVRAFTSMGLKDAKDLVDRVSPHRPQYLLREVPYYDASRCLTSLEEDGAIAILERSFVDQAEIDKAIEGLRDLLEKGQ